MQATEALLFAAQRDLHGGDKNSAGNLQLIMMEMTEALRSGANINAMDDEVSHAQHMRVAHTERWYATCTTLCCKSVFYRIHSGVCAEHFHHVAHFMQHYESHIACYCAHAQPGSVAMTPCTAR